MFANFFDFCLKFFEVFKGLRSASRVSQECRRMVKCHELNSVFIVPFSVLLAYLEIIAIKCIVASCICVPPLRWC